MKEEINELKKIIKSDIGFISDEKRLYGLLSDVFYGNVGHTNLLMTAFKCDILKNIIFTPNDKKKFISKLIKEWNIDAKKATEAVKEWYEILDYETIAKYVEVYKIENIGNIKDLLKNKKQSIIDEEEYDYDDVEENNRLYDKINNIKLVKYTTKKEDLQSVKFGDIEWLVLDRDSENALLVSKYIVDAKPYNEIDKRITWEKSSIRKWLNGKFLKSHFSKKEQEKIVLTYVENLENSRYKIDGGYDTEDKVFLLSIDEAKNYFKNDSVRETKGTDYAKKVNDGALWVSRDNGNSCFWLRSPGSSQNDAAHVVSDGSIYLNGYGISYDSVGVRPAMWVKYC